MGRLGCATAALCFSSALYATTQVKADYGEPKFRDVWDPLLREWDEPLNATRQQALAEQAAEAFQHSYRSYIANGYPADNVRPQSCQPEDVQGGAAITLLDSLDALLVFGQEEDFREAVPLVEAVSFDRNGTIDVFEITIRSLGGLLSAHAAVEQNPSLLPGYTGLFLRKARDLGDRLLPAFDTPTGIPANFLSLSAGHVANSPRYTCTACVGTLAIEFRLLSRLTGNPAYAAKADAAVRAMYAVRNPNTGLVGSAINRDSGKWTKTGATIGPGVDSYYEYLLKMFLIYGDEEYLGMFVEQYVGVQREMAVPAPLSGLSWVLDVHMSSGRAQAQRVSSLAAFWPGMQASIGLEEDARKYMAAFVHAQLRQGWMPDIFGADLRMVEHHSWPLRPELLESAFMLWALTRDARYMRLGEGTLEQLQQQARCHCGYCEVADIRNGTLGDRMESFFLAETLKYLYLLLSNGTAVNDHYVFTTEGHIIPIYPADEPAEPAPAPSAEEAAAEEGACRANASAGAAAALMGDALSTEVLAGENNAAALEARGTPDVEEAGGTCDGWGGLEQEGEGNAHVAECEAVCGVLDAETLAAQAQNGKRQFPALTFDPSSAALLRERRCRVCRAVHAEFLARPPRPTCEAALRMYVQLAECPELPKPKPKPKAIPAKQPAKVRTPLPAAAPKPRQDAAALGPHRQAMDILQDLMDLSFDLAQDMVEDATKAGLTEPPPPQQPGTIDIRCARSPRKAPPPPNICGRPGAAGFGLAAYGLCFLKAARGRLVCGRMAVVPAVGVPRTLLSTLLPVMLPARVIAVEVHMHEDVAEALVAGGDMGGLDDGTGLQLDLTWGIVGRESKGVAKVVQQLEEEAGAADRGWQLAEDAVALQVVPHVELWLLDNEGLLAATAAISKRTPSSVDFDSAFNSNGG